MATSLCSTSWLQAAEKSKPCSRVRKKHNKPKRTLASFEPVWKHEWPGRHNSISVLLRFCIRRCIFKHYMRDGHVLCDWVVGIMGAGTVVLYLTDLLKNGLCQLQVSDFHCQRSFPSLPVTPSLLLKHLWPVTVVSAFAWVRGAAPRRCHYEPCPRPAAPTRRSTGWRPGPAGPRHSWLQLHLAMHQGCAVIGEEAK